MSTWVPESKYDRCRFLITRGFLDEKDIRWLLSDVFPCHPNWKEKKKGGVKTVIIKRAPCALGHKPTFCFHIVHDDGSVEDISYQKCCGRGGHGKPSKRREVVKACRNAVARVIRKFRDGVHYPFRCPITGIIVERNEECGIDHYDMTFSDVFNAWVDDVACEWTIEELYEDVRRGTSDTVTRFQSEAMVESFVKFHNAHTHLRPVSIHESEREIKHNDSDE